MAKIFKFPAPWKHRKRIDLQNGIVHCQVSGRRLQFPKYGSKLEDGTFLIIDVMTTNEDDKERKICEIVVTKEDLLAVLEHLPVQ